MEIYVINERFSDWEGTWDYPRGYYTDKGQAKYDCELLVENEVKVGGDSSYWVTTVKVNQEVL